MNKIILIALCMMCIVGTASAYQLYLSCPETVQVGIPLKCSIDSNFPAGTTFDVDMYQTGYTATPVKSQSVTIQENHPTQYSILDTKGLPGGQYKVEIQFMGDDESRLSSDSVTLQLPILIDRSSEITITSPMTQALVDALRIEGYILKAGNYGNQNDGNVGVQIEVRGPDGDSIFGPKWIGTTEQIQSGAEEFTQKVPVIKPGQYDVYFKDVDGYIGVKTFTVIAPATTAPTAVRTTTAVTTRPPTTAPTPLPTTTKSPLSLMPIVAALSLVGILSVVLMKKR
jgi:hypothetical protein